MKMGRQEEFAFQKGPYLPTKNDDFALEYCIFEENTQNSASGRSQYAKLLKFNLNSLNLAGLPTPNVGIFAN